MLQMHPQGFRLRQEPPQPCWGRGCLCSTLHPGGLWGRTEALSGLRRERSGLEGSRGVLGSISAAHPRRCPPCFPPVPSTSPDPEQVSAPAAFTAAA